MPSRGWMADDASCSSAAARPGAMRSAHLCVVFALLATTAAALLEARRSWLAAIAAQSDLLATRQELDALQRSLHVTRSQSMARANSRRLKQRMPKLATPPPPPLPMPPCRNWQEWQLPDPCIEPKEVLFASVIRTIWSHGIMPSGSVVDAGANDGREACFYARLDGKRIIHAIDPLQRNVESLQMVAQTRHPNIRPMLGGLGHEARVLHVPKKKSRATGQQISIAPSDEVGNRNTMGSHNILSRSRNSTTDLWQAFPVERLDTLFMTVWAGETLGFAHFDTEGNELNALVGGEATIRRDAPIFTVEVMVHKSAAFTERLLAFIERLGYDVLLVEEECGLPLDCRNLVAIPRQQPGLLPLVLGLLVDDVRLERVVLVNSSNIFRRAYPCCRSGESCCRSPGACCTYQTVRQGQRLSLNQRHRGPADGHRIALAALAAGAGGITSIGARAGRGPGRGPGHGRGAIRVSAHHHGRSPPPG